MCQHTPGPWVVRPDLSIETGQSGITVAGLVDMPADAHLIAAAPAMYAALQELFVDNVDCGGIYWKIDARDMQAAKEALAQAEGKG